VPQIGRDGDFASQNLTALGSLRRTSLDKSSSRNGALGVGFGSDDLAVVVNEFRQ
jgi:hypothetical protein